MIPFICSCALTASSSSRLLLLAAPTARCALMHSVSHAQAAYIRVPPTARAAVKAAGLPFRDGLHAASHAVLNVLPAYIM